MLTLAKNKKVFELKFVNDFTDENVKSLYDNLKKGYPYEFAELPLFTLSTKTHTGETLVEKNMMITSIYFKCKNCDFQYRINKHKMIKQLKKKDAKMFDSTPAKIHMEKTNHVMYIKQTFEKYHHHHLT